MQDPNTPAKTKKKKPTPVKTAIINRQTRHRLPLRRLRRQTDLALNLLARHWPARLRAVTVVLVAPGESGKIHAEFLRDPAPTDVITFDHGDAGELIVCPAVADRQRHLENLSLSDEVLTYIIHGLLHLIGQDDLTAAAFAAMRRRQTMLRNKVLEQFNAGVINSPSTGRGISNL